MAKVTVVVITKNEEERIRRALSSVKSFADEIILVDDLSTDKTCEIAEKEFSARVFRSESSMNFAGQRNLGADKASSEWILQMDADEEVPADTAQKIRLAIASAGGQAAFEFMRLNHFMGHPIRYAGAYGYFLRMYRKDSARYREPDVHEHLMVKGAVGRIEADIFHYPFVSVQQFIERALVYTEVEAERYCRENRLVLRSDIKTQLTWRALKNFWKLYFKKKGFKDGLPGLAWCVCNTIGPQIKWLKIWEKAERRGILS